MLSLLKAKLFDERHELLPLHLGEDWREVNEPFYNLTLMLPENRFPNSLSPSRPRATLRSCPFENIRKLSRPSDCIHESELSTPIRFWVAAHGHESVRSVSVDPYSLRNHWDAAYLMWDIEDTGMLKERSDEVLFMEPFFRRAHESWTVDNVVQSEKQRSYIWLAGGRGYWPFLTKDFSRVRGLSDRQKAVLLARFKSEEERGMDHRWDSK